MSKRSYTLGLLLSVTALTCLGSVARNLPLGAPQPAPTPSKDALAHYRRMAEFPTVDYSEELPADSAERAKRIRINQRYDVRRGPIPSQPPPDITGAGSIPEGVVPPPALPIRESDLVVVGRVCGAHAHLASNKTRIYSEFDVDVTEVLKADPKGLVRVGQNVSVDQPDVGTVRYPNGRTLSFDAEGVYFPEVGESVLLFLTSGENDPSYEMLTGYELLDTYFLRLGRSSSLGELEDGSSTQLLDAARRIAISK